MKKNGAVIVVAVILLGMILLDGCQGTLPPEGYNCKTDTSWSSTGSTFTGNGVGGSYVGGSDQYRTSLDTGTFYVAGEDGMTSTQTPAGSTGQVSSGVIASQGQASSGNLTGQISSDYVTGETDGAQAGSSDSYMISDSNSRYIQAEELAGWTGWQLKVARNEIYARHGMIFKTGAIQDHFNTRSWYHGTVDAASFNTSVLNAYEWANIKTIQEAEAALGQ